MSLYDAPCNISLKILQINSEIITRKKLLSMGIRPNDSLMKIMEMTWGGVIVQNLTTNSTKLALSKSLAKDIIVDYGA